MRVEVHLHATLRKKNKGGKGQVVIVELSEGSKISDVLDELDVKLDPVHMLFVHNGRTANPDQILAEGDVVNLMTAVTGG